MNKIYLRKYILSYSNVLNILEYLEINYKQKISKENIFGYTNFNYKINVYKIGHGKKHILLIGCTHGCEIITTYFILELMITLLKNETLYNELKNEFTFHFIPILNPEGYIISTSNLVSNYSNVTDKELEYISNKYLKLYNTDDFIAKNNKCLSKMFITVIPSNLQKIDNIYLKSNVKNILNNCNLDDSFLPVWSANGCGVDINSNSIHRFKEIKKLRNVQKYASLRYNDIPVTKPSPMSYPGKYTFCNCNENLFLYKYINHLYSLKNSMKDQKLIAVFSYHSTGGEIYGYPDVCYASKNQIDLHLKGMLEYSKYTKYKLITEDLKYGVMDYYRLALKNVLSLTIELSRLNANPIGPFSNLSSFNKEIIKNKIAVINTIKKI